MDNKMLIKILKTLERHSVLLEQYNKLLEIHIKRTSQIEAWMNKHEGAASSKLILLREISIFASLGFIAARLFGWI